MTSLTIKIEPVGIAQLDTVKGILDGGDRFLQSLGFKHWDNFYTVERVAQYLKERKVYLLMYEGSPVGTVATTPDKNSSGWKDDIPSVYVSSLAVLPEYQEKGFGSVLLTLVEEEAQALGALKIRFDSIQDCDWLSEFYVRRGYSIVGKWGKPFKKFEYYLYERDVKAQQTRLPQT